MPLIESMQNGFQITHSYSLIQSVFLKQFKKADRWRQMQRQANTCAAPYLKKSEL